MNVTDNDRKFMAIAIEEVGKVLGNTAPNPSVGCVIVENGEIISKAATSFAGRPHAEINAITNASDDVSGADMYVTLEPCCFTGKTGPCSEAIIDAKIKRVFIATMDPFHKVRGKGIKQLQEAGIEVHIGLCEDEAIAINKGFFKLQQKSQPLITLKLATSLDGKIATKSGDSKWITSEKSREYVQYIRAKHDAVITGINTVLADNPMLNCRLDGLGNQSPVRIVLDSNLKIPLDSKLVKSSTEIPLWIIANQDSEVLKQEKLNNLGVKILLLEDTNNIEEVISIIAKEGITRLMVEAGGKLVASFVRSNIYDEILWFYAPKIIGGDGIDAVAGFDVNQVNELQSNVKVNSVTQIDQDILISFLKDDDSE